MTPRPYSDKSPLPTDPSDVSIIGIPIQNLSETPSPPTLSGATTPSPTPQEQVPVEPFSDTEVIRENHRTPDAGAAAAPCYPTPGDVMPYDHSLPDFIRQITNQSNLANLHSLSLRVISTLISLHRLSIYLPNLRYLDLEGSVLNSLRDIGCNLKNLQILKVGRCQLESLDGTFGLSSLRELYAQKNFINDVSPCSNLPHIRHIDVSGNRIRNISYAGFLSVCLKLKSIVFTGNPATEVSDYRKHVRRILPQLETLDGIPFLNEGKTNEAEESEVIEGCCESSNINSTSVDFPDFSLVSPSDGVNDANDSVNLFSLDKKNKQAKNLANQDQCDMDFLETSADIKTDLPLQDFHRVQKRHLEQTKTNEIKNLTTKQGCVSTLKLNKDNENRSKKTNLLSSGKFNETDVLSSDISKFSLLEKNISVSDAEAGLKVHSMEENLTKSSMAVKLTCNSSDDILEEKNNLGAIKKTTLPAVFESKSREQMNDGGFGEPSKLTTGLPVCGNLAAALRSRKKTLNAWNEKLNRRSFLTDEIQKAENEVPLEADGIKKLSVQVGGSGGCSNAELESTDENSFIEEDVLATSKKWREAFRRFRSNNRASWEEELESDFPNLLKETSGWDGDE